MADATIYVVDDDAGVRKALTSAGAILGYPVQGFASARDFLAAYDRNQSGCLVLDIKMPGMSGLELQRKLADDGITIPILMISGHADVRIAVEAMTLGAMTLLEKPFRLDELLGHLRQAIEKDRKERESQNRSADLNARLEGLTAKEREVLEMITAGKTNREIAENFGLSIRAVEDRRARLMKKVGAQSLAELVQFMSTIQGGSKSY